MIQWGRQLALDGDRIALVILVTYFCQAPHLPHEARAQGALLVYLVRALESVEPPPTSLDALRTRLAHVLKAYPQTAEGIRTYLAQWFDLLDNVDGLSELFHGKVLECLHPFHDAASAIGTVVDRRSYLGLYLRRTRLSFEMLLDTDRLQLASICAAFRAGHVEGLVDEWKHHPPARAFQTWQAKANQGDVTATKNHLHAFFDMTLPGCDLALHQHALLNLATFHLHTHAYPAARATLDEAILLARTAGDTECMRACDELAQQLAQIDRADDAADAALLARRPAATPLARGAYAPLTLWYADHDLEQGKPLLAIVQMWADATWASRSGPPTPSEAWEPRMSLSRSSACASGVLAQVWHQLGVASLAEAYVAHCARRSDGMPSAVSSLPLRAAVTHASLSAGRGAYNEAFHTLIKPSTLREVTDQRAYNVWQAALWRVVEWRARRQEHAATLRMIAKHYPDLRKAVAGTSAAYLDEAKAAMHAKQPYTSLDALMRALAHAEKQHLFPLQRAALVVLAEVHTTGLSQPAQGLQTIEEVLPFALADDDAEQRGHAKRVYAQCLMSNGAHDRALPWLVRAAQGTSSYSPDFDATENYRHEASCWYMAAKLAQHTNRTLDTDAMDKYRTAHQKHEDATTSASPDPIFASLAPLWATVESRIGVQWDAD